MKRSQFLVRGTFALVGRLCKFLCVAILIGLPITPLLAMILSKFVESPLVVLFLLPLIIPCAILLVIIAGLQGRMPRFSLQSLLLAIGIAFCLFVLWSEGTAWHAVHNFPGHCLTVALSPDGNEVAAITHTANPPIEIRETKTGRHLNTILQPGLNSNAHMAFTPDGTGLLTLTLGPGGSGARLVNWKTGEELRTWSGYPGRIATDGDRFYLYAENNSPSRSEVSVYQVDRDEPIAKIPQPSNFRLSLNDGISSTGRYLVVQTQDDQIEIWDIDENRRLGTPIEIDIRKRLARWSAHSVFSPNDRYLAIGSQTDVVILDIERFEQVGHWDPPSSVEPYHVRWSPSEDLIFVTGSRITSPTTAEPHSFLVELRGNEVTKIDAVCAAFSPNDDRIAVAFGRVKLLDPQNGELISSFRGERSARPMSDRDSIFFSPDGQWLLHNGAATVWHRRRNERWYGMFSIPAFWGADFFLICLLTTFVYDAAMAIRRGRPSVEEDKSTGQSTPD